MQKLFKALLFSLCIVTAGGAGAADKATQEQAVALVKKAAAYLNANGKDKALAEFSNPKGQFSERDLYVFVNDLEGNTLAHGGNPKLIGKNVMELKDADGKLFIKEMSDLAKSKGKGWVDYKWPNPVTKAIEAKTTYIERAGDVMIGCGIYK